MTDLSAARTKERGAVRRRKIFQHEVEIDMKRTTLLGSVAAGLMAAAVSSPAWAQATTYPEGTDCAAIQDSAARMDCTHQMNESRQLPDNGQVAPDPDGTGNIQPGAPSNAPSQSVNPAGNPATGTPGGTPSTGPDNTPGDSGNPDGTTTN
jgi:hypothetical protein